MDNHNPNDSSPIHSAASAQAENDDAAPTDVGTSQANEDTSTRTDVMKTNTSTIRNTSGTCNDAEDKEEETVKVSDRKKWLQEQAFQNTKVVSTEKMETDNSNAISKERIKRLQEQAFAKKSFEVENDNDHNFIVSHELTKDKVKWLQEQAFAKKKHEDSNDQRAAVSHELTHDKVKWLQEQAFAKKSSKDNGDEKAVVSHELTQDKVKWLQEQAFAKKSTKDENCNQCFVSHELTQDKVKWLQEQAFAKKQLEDSSDQHVTVSQELTQDKVKWLQEQAFAKETSNRINLTRTGDSEKSILQVQGDHVTKRTENDEIFLPSVPCIPTPDADDILNNSDKDMDHDDEHHDDGEEDEKEHEESSFEDENEYDVICKNVDSKDDTNNSDRNQDLYALLSATKARLAATQEKYLVSKNNDNGDPDVSSIDYEDEESDEEEEGLVNENVDVVGGSYFPTEVGIISNDDSVCLEESLTVDESIDEYDDYDDDNKVVGSNLDVEFANHSEEKKIEDDSITRLNFKMVEEKAPQDRSLEQNESKSKTNHEIRTERKQKDNKELWALLNYSKVRLATGATPTAQEANQLGITADHVLSPFVNEEGNDDDDNSATNNEDEDDAESHDEESDKESISDDEIPKQRHANESNITHSFDHHSELSFDDESFDESHEYTSTVNDDSNRKKEESDDARARALEALARVSSRESGSNHNSNKNGVAGDYPLSEKQMLQSILMAEEASQSGESEFATRDRLSFLNSIKVATPRKEAKSSSADNTNSKASFWGGIMKKKTNIDRTAKDSDDYTRNAQKQIAIGARTRTFLANTKSKAEKAINEIKVNVRKVEEQEKRINPSSPLSHFQELQKKVARVDSMYADKYQEPYDGIYEV